MDKKNEIFAESNLLKPKNLPEVIVMPDLLTPGINASTWNKPIIIADLLVNSVSIFFNFIKKFSLNIFIIYRIALSLFTLGVVYL